MVVLSSYEDFILSETGMHMKMLGPGDKERLLEKCRNIVIEIKSNTERETETRCPISTALSFTAP